MNDVDRQEWVARMRLQCSPRPMLDDIGNIKQVASLACKDDQR